MGKRGFDNGHCGSRIRNEHLGAWIFARSREPSKIQIRYGARVSPFQEGNGEGHFRRTLRASVRAMSASARLRWSQNGDGSSSRSLSLFFPLAPSPSLPAPWGQLWVMNTAAATQGQFPRCRGPAGAHKGNSPGATPPGGSAVSVLSTPSARRRSIHSVMCSKTSGLPWRGLIPNLTDWVVFLHPYPDSGLLLTLPRPRVADRGGRLWPGLGIYQY